MNVGSTQGGGNILGMLMNVASMMFPALQLANSLFNMIGQAVGEGIKGAIDQLMKESGLPKFMGEALKKLVDEVFGANQKETNPAADKAMQEQYGDQMQALSKGVQQSIVDEANKAKEETSGNAGSSTSKGGWLVALAKAFGKIADKAAHELKTAGENLTNENPSEMLEYQAKSQEFSQMMNTFTNAIKTIGEAEANTVRKG